MKKRILSMLLAIVMVVGLLPGTALAAETPFATGYCNNTGEEASRIAIWELSTDGTLTIKKSSSGGTGMDSFSTLDTNRPSWETHKAQIKKVVIEDDITSLGSYAFYNYTALEEVVIGNGIQTINALGFYGCTALTKVTIGSSVRAIQSSAFNGCASLRNVTLPSGVTTIGAYAFASCPMTEITIPASVTTIENLAFDSTSLTKVTYLGTTDPGAKSISVFPYINKAYPTINVPADYIGTTFCKCDVTKAEATTDINAIVVSATPAEGGSVAVSVNGEPADKAKKDSVVTITVTENNGYVLKSLAVADVDDENIVLTKEDNKYTFTMPEKAVVVTAVFKEDSSLVYVGGTLLTVRDYYKCANNTLTSDGTADDYNAYLTFNEATGYTLNIKDLTVSGVQNTNYGAGIYSANDDIALTINFSGTNTINGAGNETNAAIYSLGDLNISGSGMLTANGSATISSNHIQQSSGIAVVDGKSISITNANEVCANAGYVNYNLGLSQGLRASNILIDNSVVYAKGGQSVCQFGYSEGIEVVRGTLRITGADTKVEAISGDEGHNKNGISGYGGSNTLYLESGLLRAESKNATGYSSGITGITLNMTGGVFEAVCGTATSATPIANPPTIAEELSIYDSENNIINYTNDYTIFKNYSFVRIAPSHIHDWDYSASGATITAKCGTADCFIDSETLTISAPQHNKYGDGIDANAILSASKIGDITVANTDIVYTKGTESLTEAPTDAGTYKASITITVGGTDYPAYVEYTIAKAEAEIPTGLTAVYGQTLANVSLPDGWTWVEPTTSVGNVSNQVHKANYAGDNNHNAASNVELTVMVSQSGATMTATADKTSYTYGEDITVTVNIAPTAAAPQSVLLMAEPTANQVAIFNGSTQITEPQTVAGQPMTFTVTGLDVGTCTLTAKYIAGNMEGKTANTQAITITKATPTITTAPTADGITYGQTLSDSTLTGGAASVAGSFAWTNKDTVPTVSDGSNGYEVIFTPEDTTNYTTATVTVALTVAPKDITGAAVGTFAAMTYNGKAQTPAATVTINGLTAEGSWSEVTNVTDTTTFTASGNFTGKIENQNPGMQKLSLNGATITLDCDSLIYNGSAQSVTITEVKVGNVTVPADAYSLSDNTGTEVGSYTLTITANEDSNFTGSATKDFTISKSGSVIADDSIKVYRVETETTNFTYGDIITVKAQVAPTGSAAPVTFALTAPSANLMALFYNGTQISEAVYAVNGVYTMTYSTTDKVVPVGTGIALTAKYVGNANMGDTEKNVTVSLAAKPLTVVSAGAVDRDYEKNNTSVEITGVTISGKALDSDDVSVDTTNLTGSLSSDNAGTYTKVTLPALTLTGVDSVFYTISGGKVDTDVTLAQITGTTSVDASPVTYSDTSAKTQDLADVVAAFKSGSEELTYTVASKGSEIASASMDGSQLTFHLANGLTDAGTAAITVEVSGFTNYSKVTVTVNIELTDKTTVTVDMSDIVLVNRAFNGEALTYTGEAKANGYDGAFTYTWQDAEGNALTEAPSDAGTYRLAASVSDTVFFAGSNYVTVTIEPKEVTVTALDKSAYVGSAAPDLSAPVAGKDYSIAGLVDDTIVTVTLSCTPDMNKAGEYVITPSASEESGNYTFTYVNGKLTVSYRPVYSDPTYKPTIEDTTGGNTTVSDKNPEKGDKVTIITAPDKGYAVGEITVTDSKGNEVEVIDNGDGTYTYVQPVGKVTITVTYVCSGTYNCPSLAYSDLNTKQWYHEATDYVLANGLMNGVGGDKFDPDGTTSRAMIVTMLWRLEGEPVVNYLMQFEDVPADTWYTEAVRWAASEKIVEGWNGEFDPMGDITREQFVTILWRYAKHKGYDVSVGEDTNILSYEDAFSVSEYAIPAMQWACGAGLMQGDGVNLTPKADATRAQAAALFQRFCENVAEK